MRRATFLTLCFVCISCRSGQELKHSERAEVKDDVDSFMEAPIDPVHRATTPRILPTYEDAYRVEYAPDVLPWARPGYRVIFHKQLEVSTYPESHPGWPGRARIHERSPYIEEGNVGALRSIQLYAWSFVYNKGVCSLLHYL